MLRNPEWIDVFRGAIAIDPSEPNAANALRIGDAIIMAREHRHGRAMLERRGFQIDVVPLREMMKAEAGVTCCSLLFDACVLPHRCGVFVYIASHQFSVGGSM